MKRIALLLLALLACSPAQAQSNFGMPPPAGVVVIGAQVVATCGTGSLAATQAFITIDTTGKVCTAASVSASITGFPTIQSTGTPISVTTGGVTGTLPTGTEVLATNDGSTNTAYCKLGASATTSDLPIYPHSSVAFTVGANTQLTCITSTSTTTVNMTGGSGLPTGWGGGSASGGAAGNITQWNSVALGSPSAYGTSPGAVNVIGVNAFITGSALGVASPTATAGVTGSPVMAASTTAPTGVATGNVGFLNANPSGGLRNDESFWAGTALGTPTNFGTTPGAVIAGSMNASLFYGTTAAVGDPCQTNAATYTPISITTNTTTKIVTGTAAKKLYICYLYLQTAAADNVAVISGTTGGTCGSNTAGLIGGLTAANGLNNAANSGQAVGNGGYAIAQVATNNDDICLITSASTPLAGVIKTVAQ